MFQVGLSAATMKSYLAAVRHAQIAMGLGDPLMVRMPQIQYVLKGAWQLLAEKPRKTRLPIILEILNQLRGKACAQSAGRKNGKIGPCKQTAIC